MFHGNWCGPYWSDGQLQTSVLGFAPPIDEFDVSCREHDFVYAVGGDVEAADQKFFQDNFGHGLVRSIAATGVRLYSIIRDVFPDNKILSQQSSQIMSKKNLRSTNSKSSSMANQPTTKITKTSIPASIGFQIKSNLPKIVRSADKARIIGTDFAGTVTACNTSVYNPAQDVLLNPIYYNGSQLGTLSRAFSQYRMIRATLEYIPQVATSTPGQLIMVSNRSLKEPFISGSASNFLSRALSQYEATASPLWDICRFECKCSQEWRPIDVLIDSDLDDTVDHEVQVYAIGSTLQQVGILLLHYEIEFRDPIYTLHSTNIPCDIGGVYATLADDSAANAVNDAIALNNSSISFNQWTQGAVFRMVFIQAASVVPTGPANWAAVAKVVTSNQLTSTTSSIGATNITMATGSVVYGLFNSSLYLYSNLEDAISGENTGGLVYQTATTTAGTWAFFISAVRMGNPTILTSQ